MKRIKCIKRIVAFALVMIMCCGAGISTMAAESDSHVPSGWKSLGVSEEQLELINNQIQPREPAPGLSSISIIDLAVDEKNEIHIEVKVMGTAKSVLCWCNGIQCAENYNEMVDIVSGNRVVGTYRYFHTGIYYTESVVGTAIQARAQATNAMSPWNTLSATRYFTVP